MAVLHLYSGEGFDFKLPDAALREKGFDVVRVGPPVCARFWRVPQHVPRARARARCLLACPTARPSRVHTAFCPQWTNVPAMDEFKAALARCSQVERTFVGPWLYHAYVCHLSV